MIVAGRTTCICMALVSCNVCGLEERQFLPVSSG